MQSPLKIEEVLRESKVGKKVKLRGWVYRCRSSKKAAFIVLRDSTDIIQCVFKREEVGNNVFNKASELLIESAVVVSGKIRKDERAPTGYELAADDIKIVHRAEVFPITKDQSTEFLLDMRHLWLRSRKISAVLKVKHTVMDAAREWLNKDGWYETNSPIITSSACEGGSTLFELNYFGKKAYLSQSGQLYSEALIYALEKVYCFAPSFRAEKSRTTRHLAEYWHLEPEGAWIDHEENIKVQENLITHIVKRVAKERAKELRFLGRNPADFKLIKPPFKRMRYDEALEFLKKNGLKMKWGEDFGTKEEELLTRNLKVPLIVEKFPLKAKAFYMKSDPADEKLVLCNDMLAPEGFGEIIGGSERETDNSILIKRLKAQGENIKNYEWYLDLRKFGSVPHSGFGLGIERLLRWMCKLEHIRDAIPFPRTINRFRP